MIRVVPRWEWRTFRKEFGEIEKNIKENEIISQKESSEIYIVSKKSDENIKIRDGKINIKSLLKTDENNLEKWTVLLKAQFPITITESELIYQAFNLTLKSAAKEKFSLNEFLDSFVRTEKNLQIVDVSKKRFGYSINECAVELSEVKINDIQTKTIAVEHINSKIVTNTVKMLNLSGFENVSYIREIKSLF